MLSVREVPKGLSKEILKKEHTHLRWAIKTITNKCAKTIGQL